MQEEAARQQRPRERHDCGRGIGEEAMELTARTSCLSMMKVL
ncbi:hypothetical protein [Paenibacillus sp. KR2-11]